MSNESFFSESVPCCSSRNNKSIDKAQNMRVCLRCLMVMYLLHSKTFLWVSMHNNACFSILPNRSLIIAIIEFSISPNMCLWFLRDTILPMIISCVECKSVLMHSHEFHIFIFTFSAFDFDWFGETEISDFEGNSCGNSHPTSPREEKINLS